MEAGDQASGLRRAGLVAAYPLTEGSPEVGKGE